MTRLDQKAIPDDNAEVVLQALRILDKKELYGVMKSCGFECVMPEGLHQPSAWFYTSRGFKKLRRYFEGSKLSDFFPPELGTVKEPDRNGTIPPPKGHRWRNKIPHRKIVKEYAEVVPWPNTTIPFERVTKTEPQSARYAFLRQWRRLRVDVDEFGNERVTRVKEARVEDGAPIVYDVHCYRCCGTWVRPGRPKAVLLSRYKMIQIQNRLAALGFENPDMGVFSKESVTIRFFTNPPDDSKFWVVFKRHKTAPRVPDTVNASSQ